MTQTRLCPRNTYRFDRLRQSLVRNNSAVRVVV